MGRLGDFRSVAGLLPSTQRCQADYVPALNCSADSGSLIVDHTSLIPIQADTLSVRFLLHRKWLNVTWL